MELRKMGGSSIMVSVILSLAMKLATVGQMLDGR